MVCCAKGIFLLGLANPAITSRMAEVMAQGIKDMHTRTMRRPIGPKCLGATTDCRPTVKKTCRGLRFIGASCPPHIANKALEYTFRLDPELKAMFLHAPSFASRVAVLSNGFWFEKYCKYSSPTMTCQNLATFSFARWADVSKAVHHVVVVKKANIGFHNVRDERSAAIRPANYIPTRCF
jgi:hypothetical protein